LDPSIALTAGGMGTWTADEDIKLKAAVQMHGTSKDWAAIAVLVPSRTKTQCRNRWKNALDPSIALLVGPKIRWTADEDIELKNAIQIHGGKNWKAVTAMVQGRTKKQCHGRWHYLGSQYPLR
jgi:hypothetical protein